MQVLEIKRLNGAIAAVKSELSKQQERLEECKRYAGLMWQTLALPRRSTAVQCQQQTCTDTYA